MLFEEENLIQNETERKLQIYIEQLINDLYRKERIEVNSKNLLELLSYLTSNENISTQMKTATEYQNRKIVDILHKIEVDKYKTKNKDLSNQILILYKEQDNYNARIEKKNAEIEKKDKMIDLMADELVEAHEYFYSEFDNFTKEDFIKYFEQKATNNG